MKRYAHRVGRPSFVALTLAVSLLAPFSAGTRAKADTPSGLDPGLTRTGRTLEHVIVTGGAAVAHAVHRAGGHVTATLDLVGGVAAVVRADRLAALAADPRVRAVTADRQAHFDDFSFDDSTTASLFTRTTQATGVWNQGALGEGIGVAVLDTGVSTVPDLAGRIVHGPDLSGEGTTIDNFGHGTVMAGIIAGDGHDSATRNKGAYTGVAPKAHIVAVKAAGRNGVVDVSTILQAMHWVDAYRTQFNIRVLNLSWGVHATQDPNLDPLNYAVQRLWGDGIVVVVSAGNGGPGDGTIAKPADDPVVISVGAFNGRGDLDPSNDEVPEWSSRGPTVQGVTKPDIIAPGRSLTATRSFGSQVSMNNPYARVWPSYIRGSGTSHAAAVTSGVVALLLAARPELTPDQVKELLVTTAAPIEDVDARSQGAGRIQAEDALEATPEAAPQERTATGRGWLEKSRGGAHVVTECDGVSTEISGEIDVRCAPWDPEAWTTSAWTNDSWTGVSWKGSEWNGVSWKDAAWSEASWDGVSWKGGTWTGGSWHGSAWTGASEPTSPWSGVSWKESEWAGVSWKDASWTSQGFASAGYDADPSFMTAFWGGKPPPGRHIAGEYFTPTRYHDYRDGTAD
jgi:serine protease AprX